jgi:hypothetical protein
MKSEPRWYWLVRRAQLEALEVWQVMDLLRYDVVTVERDNAFEGCWLLSAAAEPSWKRMVSYSIVIQLKTSTMGGVEGAIKYLYEQLARLGKLEEVKS